MKKMIIISIIFLSFFTTVFGENKIDYAELKIKIQSTLDSIHKSNGFPGATIAISLPGDRTITFATGYAFPEKNIKMKSEDRMFIGSTGKTFVSAVMLKLVEEGKLNLDDKVSKFLGHEDWYNRIPNHEELTIRMLARHNGGLPRYILNPQFGKDIMDNVDKVWKPVELLSYIFDQEPIHPPEDGWEYSDTDFIIIGMIIEKVCDNSIYNEIDQYFLKLLNLDDTSPSDSRELRGLIQGHSGDTPFVNAPAKVIKNNVYFLNPQFEWTGGGFISNSIDMVKWTDYLYSGKLLSEKSMELLLSPVSFETGKPAEEGYGLGAIITKTDFGMKYGHTGQMPGYITELGYFQDFDVAIALQINEDNYHGNPKQLGLYSSEILRVIVKYISTL